MTNFFGEREICFQLLKCEYFLNSSVRHDRELNIVELRTKQDTWRYWLGNSDQHATETNDRYSRWFHRYLIASFHPMGNMNLCTIFTVWGAQESLRKRGDILQTAGSFCSLSSWLGPHKKKQKKTHTISHCGSSWDTDHAGSTRVRKWLAIFDTEGTAFWTRRSQKPKNVRCDENTSSWVYLKWLEWLTMTCDFQRSAS